MKLSFTLKKSVWIFLTINLFSWIKEIKKKTANIVANSFNKRHPIKQGTPKHGKTEQWELVLISEIDEKFIRL